jgi:Spy/CpxP family protein refolding chaperone
MMRWKGWMQSYAVGLAPMACAGLLGCSMSAASGPVPATAESALTADDDLTSDLYEHHRHHHRGGVTMFIAMSLDSLGLPPERRAAIARIQSDLFTTMAPARAAEQAVLTALADGMAAGAIDKARVDAAIEQLESASGLVHVAAADALDRLHAALTPPERAALVDKVAAHWTVFAQTSAQTERVGHGYPSAHLAYLARELELTGAQIDKIGASFTRMMAASRATFDPAEVDAHLHRFEAFRADTFSAKTLADGGAVNAHIAARGAIRMARFYEAVDPELTPEQRAKLVVMLRDHATHTDTTAAMPQ